MKKILAVALAGLGAAGFAHAASFTNGGFESNSFSGWEQGSGCWGYYCGSNTSIPYAPNTGAALPLNSSLFFSGGTYYNPTAVTGSQILSTAGTDPITGGSLKAGANYGNYVAKINDSNNNYSVAAIRQSVTNYSGTSINFAWWAMLESSHGGTDSDYFSLKVLDGAGGVLYNQYFSSFSSPGTFTQFGSWYSSGWQEVSLAVTQGGNYTIELLASDCPYGGHAGYVYLDGFGTTQGGGGDDTGQVPEPASLALVGLALAGLGATRRRKTA